MHTNCFIAHSRMPEIWPLIDICRIGNNDINKTQSISSIINISIGEGYLSQVRYHDDVHRQLKEKKINIWHRKTLTKRTLTTYQIRTMVHWNYTISITNDLCEKKRSFISFLPSFCMEIRWRSPFNSNYFIEILASFDVQKNVELSSFLCWCWRISVHKCLLVIYIYRKLGNIFLLFFWRKLFFKEM